MKKLTLLFISTIAYLLIGSNAIAAATDSIMVKHIADFDLTGDGESKQWKSTEWHIMPQRRDTTNSNETKFKMLYSDKAFIFCLIMKMLF